MKTIAEHIASFGDDLQMRNYSPRTISDYRYCLGVLCGFLEQRKITDAAAITGADLTAFQRWHYYEPTQRGHARGVGHQNFTLAAVRSFFRFLRREGCIVRDPAAEIEYAREPRRLPRNVLTMTEAKLVLQIPDTSTAVGYRDRTILEVLYATGLRNSELRNLRVSDVNLEDGLLRVNCGKGAADRVVPLGATACRCLETYIAAIRLEFARLPRARSKPADYLFLSMGARAFDPHSLNDLVKHYAKLAGIKKHITCHSWRHTCATHLIQNRANVRHVQEMLGHRALTTTERYLRLTITDLKAAHQRYHPRERKGNEP